MVFQWLSLMNQSKYEVLLYANKHAAYFEACTPTYIKLYISSYNSLPSTERLR